MLIGNTLKQWGVVSKTFHWVIGIAMIAMLALGIYLAEADLPGKERYPLILAHKAVGICLLFAVVLRFVWRLFSKAPKMPEGSSKLEILAAHGGHWLLYILMFALPLSGWLMSSAAGYPVTVWGFEQYFGFDKGLPALVEKSEEIGRFARGMHELVGYGLIVVIVGHVGAALKHHFWNKDTVLKRMMPFGRVGE